MRTKDRYTSFFNQSSNYDYEQGNFAGLCNKIPEDDNKEPPSDQPTQSHNNLR